MQERMIELEEENALLEELNVNLEQYNGELNVDIETKDKEVTDLKDEVDQLEQIVLDQDSAEDKYKDRTTELGNQIKVLTEQL